MLDTYNQSIQEEVSCTIRTNVNTANHHFIVMEAKIIKEGNYSPSGHNASSIVSAQGIAPTVMENHGTVTAIKEPQVINPLKGKSESGVANTTTSVQKDSMVAEQIGKQMANTLDIGCLQGVVEKEGNIRYRIRKLTPRECFRLMGVDDTDIDKIQASGISNSQQYKCAGNSIVVDVLFHLFRKMFVETENESGQLTLF